MNASLIAAGVETEQQTAVNLSWEREERILSSFLRTKILTTRKTG